MGSLIEINDTLKISKSRGFPHELVFEKHQHDPAHSSSFIGKEFSFWNAEERLYNRPPARVFLVEEIDGKWLYWGHAHVIEQTIKSGKTEGKFRITKLYSPAHQKAVTPIESPEGKSFL